MQKFNLASAQQAQKAGEIEQWVHDYLCGPGNNRSFSDGLRREKRLWWGPFEAELMRLQRTCGPEPGMPYRVPEAGWLNRVNRFAASFEKIRDFPPLIIQWVNGQLLINDGNHRYAAYQEVGLTHCWVIMWWADLTSYREFVHRGGGITVIDQPTSP